MEPKVSVVIATHDHAHFLPDCLNSVRAQTYKDYEVILVDNGSKDNTKEVVKRLTWDKLKYFYQEDTGSVAGPRNTGLKHSSGKYVSFLDSDDLWYPEKLSKAMKVFNDHADADIVSHELLETVEGKASRVLKVGPGSDNMFELLLQGNRLLGSATTIKRSVLMEVNGIDESKCFVHVEDYETWLRLAHMGKKFYFIHETLGEYRVHKKNLSHDYERAFNNERNVLIKHFASYKQGHPFKHFIVKNDTLGMLYLRLVLKNIGAGSYFKAAYNLIRSLAHNPFRPFGIILKYFWRITGNSKAIITNRTDVK